MVFYNRTARTDLENIRLGLLNWRKIVLTSELVFSYMKDIRAVCDRIDTKSYHSNCIFEVHKIYGSKVHAYRRNKNTTWYIIYDIDSFGNVFINKIISNYLTTE